MLTVAQLGGGRGLRYLLDNDGSGIETGESRLRKDDMRKRIRIDNEDFRELVALRIAETYDTATARTFLNRFITTAVNPLRRIADRISEPVYKNPPVRELREMEEESKKWSKAMKEARIRVVSKQWARYAFICNVCYVVPVIHQPDGSPDPKLRFDLILPHAVDGVFDSDPRNPDILVWDKAQRVEGFDLSQVDTRIALDSEAWYYFDHNWELVRTIPHGLGVRPWSEARVSEPPPGMYWHRTRGDKLVTATLDAARVATAMGWVRKDQNRKIMTMFAAEVDGIPESQVISPEKPFIVEGDPGTVIFGLHDFDTAIDNFQKEISWHENKCAESFGIPNLLVDLGVASEEGFSTVDVKTQNGLSEVREAQIEHLREFEEDLAWKTSLVMDRFNHPEKVSPDDVKENFQITWPPLTFVDHPLVKLKVQVERLKLGQTDHVSIYQEDHPGTSREEAQKAVEEHIDTRNEINEKLAIHQTPKDPREEGETVPAIQGRVGGLLPNTPNSED